MQLGEEDVGLAETAGGREISQFGVGLGRPEEVTEAVGKVEVRDGPLARSRRRLFQAVEERGRDENSSERQSNGLFVSDFFLSQPGVEVSQFGGFGVGQWSPIGFASEVEDGGEMSGLGVSQDFS